MTLRATKHLLLANRSLPAEHPSLATATASSAVPPGTSGRPTRCSASTSPAIRTSIPLLLPDGFEGHPLRKDFVLAARAAKPWPGAKEPGRVRR